MSASDILNGPALPSEVNYALSPSIPSGWQTRQMKVPTISGLPPSNMAGNEFIIQIPQLPNTFLDPTTAFLNLQVTVNASVASSKDISAIANAPMLMGSGWSIFNRYEAWFNNSQLLDQIQYPGVLYNAMSNMTLAPSQRQCMPNNGYSSIAGANAGVLLHAAEGVAATYSSTKETMSATIDLCLPLIGVLGAATEKLLPMFLGGFRLNLLTADVRDFIKSGVEALAGVSYSFTAVEFVAQTVVVDPSSMAAILSQHPEKMFVRSSSFVQASQPIAAKTGAGMVELLIPPRVTSAKGIIVCCSPADAYEGIYAGVCPNLTTGSCVSLNGTYFPQQTIDPCANPMQVFASNQVALNALYSGQHSGSVTRKQFCTASTTGASNNKMFAYASSVSAARSSSAPYYLPVNGWYWFVDTEVFGRKGKVFLSGTNTKAGANFLRCNIGAELANAAHTVNMFVYYDSVLVIDLQSGTITRSF